MPRDAYDRLVTSGDAAHAALAARDDPAHAALGSNYLFVGPGWDGGLMEGLEYRRVEEVGEADFLLAVGLFDEADPIERYDPLFAAATARDLVLLCVNPDIVIYRQGGVTAPCAGWLARHYREAYGGRVLYHGKPDPAIFRRAAQALGQSDDARILVVGDSLATDIAGAIAAGYDSLFVTRGIHAEEIGIAPGAEPDPAAPGRGVRAPGPAPDHGDRHLALVTPENQLPASPRLQKLAGWGALSDALETTFLPFRRYVLGRHLCLQPTPAVASAAVAAAEDAAIMPGDSGSMRFVDAIIAGFLEPGAAAEAPAASRLRRTGSWRRLIGFPPQTARSCGKRFGTRSPRPARASGNGPAPSSRSGGLTDLA